LHRPLQVRFYRPLVGHFGWWRFSLGIVRGQRGAVGRLFFGRDDAENDLADGLLEEGFLFTYAYEAAQTGRKSLIIGRKGSGKSAICRRLIAKGGYDGPTILITPDDAAGDEIRRFELQGLTGDTAKSLIWRYVFAVQAARHLTAQMRTVSRRKTPGSVRALRSFLHANQEAEEQQLYDRLQRGVRGLQSASLSLKAFGVVEASINATGASEGARASRLLEVLERGVAAAFDDLDPERENPALLFLVDQLEQVWTIDPDSHAMVTGLLLAAKHVTSEYRKSVRCALFLRSDIYDTLNFGDGDKFHSDEIRITWSRSGLRDLALTRASASLKRSLTREQLWGEVFPATIEGEHTADYLFSRCLPRPRDAIQFLTVCRDTADEHGHQTVQEEDVLRATLQFSQWKLQDLAKEYLVNYPFLKSLFALFENTGYVVMRQALQNRFEAQRESLHQEFPAYAEHLNPRGVIDALYAVSFLGVKRGNQVVYAGGVEAPIQPNETEFHVHPCFRPALNGLNPLELPTFPAAPHHWATNTGFVQSVAQGDVGFGVSRDFRLIDEVTRSCESILRQLSRSDLPAATRDEVSQKVAWVLHDANEKRQHLRFGETVDAAAHAVTAANYLSSLAEQLATNGIHDERVLRRFDDETRSLIRAVGGAIGGGRGASESY
jgi:hypothetical protein